MLLQTLQHILSQLLAPARSDVRTSAMAVTEDGRIVPVNATKVDWLGRCFAAMSGKPGPTTAGDATEFYPGHSQPTRSAKT